MPCFYTAGAGLTGTALFADTCPTHTTDTTVNVRSVFVASKAAAAHMKDGGRIINIGSTNAQRMPFPGGAAYAMSKSALTGLVKGLARDLDRKSVV